MARTASIFTINGKGVGGTGRRGFTLVELLIASVLSAVVFAAIFSAYLFMARNLTRLANSQQQQVQNRRALYVMAKDVSETVQVNNALPATLNLTLSSGDVIIYTYTAPIPGPPIIPGMLTRTVNGAIPAPVLLSNLTGLTFSYFDQSGGIAPPIIFIKQIELSYSSAVGDPANGTQSHDIVVSPRMVLRSKPPPGQ